MMIVKLGGSVITRKDRYRSFRRATTRRLVDEIAEAGEQVILVHGAGSFGHLIAAEHELHLGHKSEKQVPALARVMLDVRDLNLRVMNELMEARLPAVSIPPATCARMRGGKLVSLDTKLFSEYIELGALPVTFGDAVLDDQLGFGICSGDQLIERLAKIFKPSRIVFCADVDGVYDADPKQHDDATFLETVDASTVRRLKEETSYVDVTGGMVGKLRAMMRMSDLGAEIMVINGFAEGRLKAALKGERVIASRVVGRKR